MALANFQVNASRTSTTGKADIGTLGERRSGLSKVLDVIQTPQFATVGVVKEFLRRDRGLAPRSFAQAARNQVKRRKGFEDIVGNPWIGFGMNLVLDPINLIPGAAIVKGAKFAGKVTGIAKGTEVLVEAVPAIAKLKNAVGRGFNVGFGKSKQVRKLQAKFREEYDFLAGDAEEQMIKRFEAIEPDENIREGVFNLLGSEPVSTAAKTIDNAPQAFGTAGANLLPVPGDDLAFTTAKRAFDAKVAALSPVERQLFDEGLKVRAELEKVKLEWQIVTQKQLAGFAKKFGLKWVPFRQMTKQNTVNRLRELRRAKKLGNDVRPDISLDELDSVLVEIDKMGGALTPEDVATLNLKTNEQIPGFKPSASFARKTFGTPEEAATHMQRSMELDIARAFGIEARQTARSVAARKYVIAMRDEMKRSGLLFDDGEDILARLVPQFGKLEARKIFNRGFRKLDGEEFKGLVAPRDVANDINRTTKAYKDPKAMHEIMNTYTKVQNQWKAWTLFVSPAYHTRNIVSNFFNNYLAGMDSVLDPRIIEDYAQSFGTLMKARKSGKMGTHKMFGELTEKQMWREAQKKGVVRGGQIQGELGQLMHNRASLKTMLRRPWDAKSNPGIQFSMRRGAEFEDHARLAHFMWRLRKGDDATTAARSVNKFLFDYRYGLTKFEKGVFRDVLLPFYAWCLPTDTECLTEKGWLRHSQLKKGMKVLAYDKGRLRWEPLQDWKVFDYDGVLFKQKGKTSDILCTPNHRWPCVDQQGRHQIRMAYEMRSNFKIPIAGEFEQESLVSSADAAKIGWIYTDGDTGKRGSHTEVLVYQSPKKHLDQIVNLFGSAASVRNAHPDPGVVPIGIIGPERARLIKLCPNKEALPEFVSSLGSEAAEAMYRAMMDAEGHRAATFDHFSQLPGPVLDAFQMLCLLTGRAANISRRGCYIRKHKFIKFYKWDTEWYKGQVWCPVTPSGTWVSRRNGKVVITGNSRFNIPLQLEMLVRTPRKFAAVDKAIRGYEDQFGGPDPDELFLAGWLKQAYKIRRKYNKKDGTYEYFVLDSWWPAADIGKVMKIKDVKGVPVPFVNKKRLGEELVNMWSPIMKMPMELLFNYNLFKKRKIVDFPGQEKRILGTSIDANAEHMLRSIRIINDVDRGLQGFDREGWKTAVIRPLIGRSYPVDFKKQQKYWDFQTRARLRELARQRSISERVIEQGRIGGSGAVGGVRAAKKNLIQIDQHIKDLEQLRKDIL